MLADNPIFQRESTMRFWEQGPSWIRITVTSAIAIIALCCAMFEVCLSEGYGNHPLGLASIWPGILAPLLIPALMAGAVAGERERQSWDVIVLSRMSPAEIIWGKLLSRVAPLLWGSMFFIPAMVVTAIFMLDPRNNFGSGMHQGDEVLFVALIIIWPWIGGTLLTLAHGVLALYISMRTSNTRTALLLSYGTIVGVLMLLLITSGVLSLFLFPYLRLAGPRGDWVFLIEIAALLFIWGGALLGLLLPYMTSQFAKINTLMNEGSNK
jgi:hypothetical protein